MQYNDPSEKELVPEKPLDDYFDGSQHSTFRKRNAGFSMAGRFSRIDLPMVLIGIIVLVLVVFLVVVAMNSGGSDGDVRLVDLENRLKKIEEQIATLGAQNEQLQLIELQEKKLSVLIDRVSRLEGERLMKAIQVEKKPEPTQAKVQPQPKPAAPPQAKPAAAKPAAAKQPVAGKKAAARIHHVKAGETVFGIARQNGLSVDALRRLNPSLNGNDIFPGQQLKVSAP
ncbi:MAG: LysM peptidoglycan-binding domain-containing protein [Thermodesulfobacteriota bacterium]